MSATAAAVPPTAVLFLTHVVNSAVIARFRRLERALAGGHDLYLGVDLPSLRSARRVTGDLVGPRLVPFNRALLGRLPYERAREPWEGSRSVVPGRVDLVAQFFRRLHPAYQRLYLVEYDVVYGGDWRTLFADLDSRPADLLGTNAFRLDEHPGWNLWSTLRIPGGPLPADRVVRMLLAFCRYSWPALQALEAAYAAGWKGHFEPLVPTVLLQAGLTLEDIGGEGPFVPPGRERRYYWSQRIVPYPWSAPGTFVYRPPQHPPGRNAWLWHPVKPGTRMDLRHRLRRRRHGHLDLPRFLQEDSRYRGLDAAMAG